MYMCYSQNGKTGILGEYLKRQVFPVNPRFDRAILEIATLILDNTV